MDINKETILKMFDKKTRGRFDILGLKLTHQEILKISPKILLRISLERYGIEMDENRLNQHRNPFHKWVQRKKRKIRIEKTEQTTPGKRADDDEKQGKFKFTDPTKVKIQKPIISVVK